jgi:hypothetical protein
VYVFLNHEIYLNDGYSSSSANIISPEIAKQTWNNLKKSLEELQARPVNPTNNGGDDDDDDDDDNQGDDMDEDNKMDDDDDGPPTKRHKRENGQKVKKKKKEFLVVIDPFNLYRHTIRMPEDEDDDPKLIEDEAARDLKTTMGGKLSQLTVSGLLNGLSGHLGGVVQNKKLQKIPDIPADSIPTAHGVSLAQLKQLAYFLHHSIQTRIEADVLVTTPIRIQEMLAPDLTPFEFKAIRKR